MDPQLSSNANSALVSTLDRIPAAQFNPFEYSVSRFIPPHANQTQAILPESQGAARPGGTTVFQLPKIGILTDAVVEFELEYDMPTLDSAGRAILGSNIDAAHDAQPMLVPGGRGWLDLIDRITFENSNREIFTLSNDAIMALYSDLSLENRKAFCKSVSCLGDPFQYSTLTNKPSNSEFGRSHVSVPLMMCLTSSTELMSMLSFLEPCQLKVRWASHWENYGVVYAGCYTTGVTASGCYAIASAVNPIAVSFPSADPPVYGTSNSVLPGACRWLPRDTVSIHSASVKLNCNFAQLPQQLTSSLVEKNYGDGSLSQLTWDMEQLTPVTFNLPYAGQRLAPIVIPINTAKCVSDIYVMMYIPRSDYIDFSNPPANAAAAYRGDVRGAFIGSNALLPLESIALYGSGQVLMDETSCTTLSAWSRRTMSGENGGFWSTSTEMGGLENTLANGLVLDSLDGEARGRTDVFATGDRAGTSSIEAVDPLNGCYCYKIPISKLSQNKNFLGNTLSAREMSNFHLRVQVPQWFTQTGIVRRGVTAPFAGMSVGAYTSTDDEDRQAQISVVLRTHGITQTDAQSGRVTSVLAN